MPKSGKGGRGGGGGGGGGEVRCWRSRGQMLESRVGGGGGVRCWRLNTRPSIQVVHVNLYLLLWHN